MVNDRKDEIMTTDMSYLVGSKDVPLLDLTIGQALDGMSNRFGDKDAVISVHQSLRWSFEDLRVRADSFAAGLAALGLEPGDRIGIWAPNCAEWTLTQFASAKLGLILVNINPAYRSAELLHALTLSRAKAIICYDRFKSSDYPAMLEEILGDVWTSSGLDIAGGALPSLKIAIKIGSRPRPGWFRFDDIPALATGTSRDILANRQRHLGPHDPINIQFTSGTTGRPKGATLSHHGILNNGNIVGRAMNLSPGDRMCIPVPLFHAFGMVMGNISCLMHGTTMIYPSEGFDVEAVLRTVEREGCTALLSVPTMFIATLEHPRFDTFDLSTLRTGTMGGSPCPITVMRKVIERMNMREVTVAYGMTETSPVSFQGAFDDPIERRVSSIGTLQPHLEAKLIDEQGQIVPLGSPGEICVRGYSVMLGYWDDPAQTAAAIDNDGWMHTGDIGVFDHQGYANIAGRVKDMIIRGGENIYPREIEEFLHQHPAIADAQVVGVPDPRFGEAVCAWIRLVEGATLTEVEIQEHCRSRLAHFKIPAYVRFISDYPMTQSGKVMKHRIRESMIEELHLGVEATA